VQRALVFKLLKILRFSHVAPIGGEIWQGGRDLWSPPPCQISPQSVQRLGYRSLKPAARGSLKTQDAKVAKNRHLGTIVQLCQAISSQLRHISTIGKNLLSSSMSSTCPHKPSSGWDWSGSLGHPCKFQRVSRLGSVTARHLVVGVSQTLQPWTEGATYVRQGDHHVGH